MKLNDLSPLKGSKKKKKRVGRGHGSGHGKTSCRGHKGQKARSGGSVAPGFEGGQMPLQRRLPKRGFTNIFKKEYSLINIRDLNRFEPNSELDSDAFQNVGLIKQSNVKIKLLANGEISIPLVIKVNKVSKSAREKVESAGGKVVVV
jgi:large subunit ribosomal protein L15